MGNKTFILGVGAQKSGTTWLHSQLNRNSSVDMGFMKEYHVFDSIYVEGIERWRNEIVHSVLESEKKGLLGRGKAQDENLVKRLSFLDNVNNYFDYFDYLYLKNNDVKAVGDITPSYALLSEKAFKCIKEGLETRGFSVKVVFLIRDPVERIWSQVKMEKTNRVKKGISSPFNELTQLEELSQVYKFPNVQGRTRYNKTMEALEKVFPSEDIFYGVYESFFTKDTYEALAKFLSLDLEFPELKLKINESSHSEVLPPELIKEISMYYSDIYQFISNKFDNKMNDKWIGYQYING